MGKTIRDILTAWHKDTTDRQKLQWTYLLVTLALLVVAGLVSLINYEISQRILIIVLATAAVFLVNTVIWALLQSLVLLPLDKPSTSTSGSTQTRRRRATRASTTRKR